jgi:hypothetical protein
MSDRALYMSGAPFNYMEQSRERIACTDWMITFA